MGENNFKAADYKPSSIGYWPSFTSTSVDITVAEHFADERNVMGVQKEKDRVIFKIYLTLKNQP